MVNQRFDKMIVSLLFMLLLTSSVPLLWPQPSHIVFNSEATPLAVSPCEIKYIIESPISSMVEGILDFYLKDIFHCQQMVLNQTLRIVVRSANITTPTETQKQSYSLIIRQSGLWQLTADYYSGFLRGIQTYSQLFSHNEEDLYYRIQGIPIIIDDTPEYKWRGVMIDSSRHFLPVDTIKRTIDALMFNKMNVLHWHIIDQDSFPLQVPIVPELSEFGTIGGIYAPSDVKQVIAYAKSRGVRVVVQIDTPAHTHSWGRSEKFKDIVVNCNKVYTGQFDPTLDATYDVVKQVMQYANSSFQDTYIHFGGDQTSGPCWDLKPSIKQWMTNHQMTSYKQLQTYYRKKQKSIWRTLSNKKAIYWANQAIDLPLETDDVLQWWGISTNLDRLVGRPNEVILSSYDFAYLDKGFGNRNGIDYGNYIKWRDIYAFNPRLEGVNVIGGEACMWSELSSPSTHHQKIWNRASIIAERLWNNNVSIKDDIRNIAERLVAQSRRMQQRGYKVSPVTVGLCEEDMSICF